MPTLIWSAEEITTLLGNPPEPPYTAEGLSLYRNWCLSGAAMLGSIPQVAELLGPTEGPESVAQPEASPEPPKHRPKRLTNRKPAPAQVPPMVEPPVTSSEPARPKSTATTRLRTAAEIRDLWQRTSGWPTFEGVPLPAETLQASLPVFNWETFGYLYPPSAGRDALKDAARETSVHLDQLAIFFSEVSGIDARKPWIQASQLTASYELSPLWDAFFEVASWYLLKCQVGPSTINPNTAEKLHQGLPSTRRRHPMLTHLDGRRNWPTSLAAFNLYASKREEEYGKCSVVQAPKISAKAAIDKATTAPVVAPVVALTVAPDVVTDPLPDDFFNPGFDKANSPPLPTAKRSKSAANSKPTIGSIWLTEAATSGNRTIFWVVDASQVATCVLRPRADGTCSQHMHNSIHVKDMPTEDLTRSLINIQASPNGWTIDVLIKSLMAEIEAESVRIRQPQRALLDYLLAVTF